MYALQLLRCSLPDPLDPPPSLVTDMGRCFQFASDAPGKLDYHIALPFLLVVVFAGVLAGFARLIEAGNDKIKEL